MRKIESLTKPVQHGVEQLVLGDYVTGLVSGILTEKHRVLLPLRIHREQLANAVQLYFHPYHFLTFLSLSVGQSCIHKHLCTQYSRFRKYSEDEAQKTNNAFISMDLFSSHCRFMSCMKNRKKMRCSQELTLENPALRSSKLNTLPILFITVLAKAIYIVPKSIKEDIISHVSNFSFVRTTLLCLQNQA